MKTFEVEAVVEINMGSMFKYEVDKTDGTLYVDRPLPEPLPYNYGSIPKTLHGDGDPLDVCILGINPVFPRTRLMVEVLGAYLCDDNGESDHKILAKIVGERYEDHELQEYRLEVKNYLTTYKSGFKVLRLVDREDAMAIIRQDRKAYSE